MVHAIGSYPSVAPLMAEHTEANGGSNENDICPKCGKTKYPKGRQKPKQAKRVYENGNPKYQLRQGEEGVSIFYGKIPDADILAKFRVGSKIVMLNVDEIEMRGLIVVQTHGDCDHFQQDVLEDNHWKIRPASGMTRSQFKAV